MTDQELKEVEVATLHKHPNLLIDCCQLINSEWPRSETARMRSLQSSGDKLPTNLILLRKKKVIGHCKLTPIPAIKNGCFVETVVIAQELRGLGLGTYLMIKAEEYCKNILNLKAIYLSTKGQEKFYSKLGYTICEPISIYGCSIIQRTCNEITYKPKIKIINNENNNSNCSLPPPALPKNDIPLIMEVNSKKTFMKKDII